MMVCRGTGSLGCMLHLVDALSSADPSLTHPSSAFRDTAQSLLKVVANPPSQTKVHPRTFDPDEAILMDLKEGNRVCTAQADGAVTTAKTGFSSVRAHALCVCMVAWARAHAVIVSPRFWIVGSAVLLLLL